MHNKLTIWIGLSLGVLSVGWWMGMPVEDSVGKILFVAVTLFCVWMGEKLEDKGGVMKLNVEALPEVKEWDCEAPAFPAGYVVRYHGVPHQVIDCSDKAQGLRLACIHHCNTHAGMYLDIKDVVDKGA